MNFLNLVNDSGDLIIWNCIPDFRPSNLNQFQSIVGSPGYWYE